VEPIRKVGSRRDGIDPAAAVDGLWRVDRREEREEREEADARPRKRPAQPAVRRDADGRPHVDVQA